MMRLTGKRLLLAAALLGLAVAALTLLGAYYLAKYNETSRVFEGARPYLATSKRLAEVGPAEELTTLLRQFPHPPGWAATFIVETPLDESGLPAKPILVSDPPELKGMTAGVARQQLRVSRGWLTPSLPIAGPGGKAYTVVILQSLDLRIALNYLMVAGAALAWLSLALWLFADAWGRTSAAPGCLLLGLITGPLGLAVWLIARPAPRLEPSPEPRAGACPGCGSDTVPGAAFCVRCGYALHAACCECRRPVEPDWTYCGACGAPLNE